MVFVYVAAGGSGAVLVAAPSQRYASVSGWHHLVCSLLTLDFLYLASMFLGIMLFWVGGPACIQGTWD